MDANGKFLKEVKATLVERISKKGSPYLAISVELTDNYKKTVFLEPAEIEIVKMSLNDVPTNFYE